MEVNARCLRWRARASVALFGALGAALGWAAPGALSALSSRGLEFADLLVAVLTAAAVAVYCWLAFAAVITVLARSGLAAAGLAGRVADRLAPALWRRTVLAAWGCAVAVLPVTTAWGVTLVPAIASAGGGPFASAAGDPGPDRHRPPLFGLPLPDRPVGDHPSIDRVVVRPGDSLWAIADQELGHEASASQIAERWRQWYRANRQVIGPDPDLILPGTVLRDPGPTGPPRGER